MVALPVVQITQDSQASSRVVQSASTVSDALGTPSVTSSCKFLAFCEHVRLLHLRSSLLSDSDASLPHDARLSRT